MWHDAARSQEARRTTTRRGLGRVVRVFGHTNGHHHEQDGSNNYNNNQNPHSAPSWNHTTEASSMVLDLPATQVLRDENDEYNDDDLEHEQIRDAIHHRPEHCPTTATSISLKGSNSNSSSSIEFKKESRYGGGTLGDIMSSGLVTVPRLPLAETFGFFNPLDRMVLTANGNLQRLVSSYYDSAVSVYVDSCTPRLSASTQSALSSTQSQSSDVVVVWDRVVHLMVFNQTFCVATSVITVRDHLCVGLVESGKVGLGQLFRYMDLLPEFCLVNADRNNKSNNDNDDNDNTSDNRNKNNDDKDTGFWREYTLECAEVSCRIHENFIGGLWDMSSSLPPPPLLQDQI